MGEQYLRTYELIIEGTRDPDPVTLENYDPFAYLGDEIKSKLLKSEVRTIRELRIQFEVTRSLTSTPNKAKITLFNASPDTVSLLQSRGTTITLNVGYGGQPDLQNITPNNVKMIFTGEVQNVLQKKIGVDRTITMFAWDGRRSWMNSIYNKTWNKNVPTKQVIEDIVAGMGLGEPVIQGLDSISDKLLGQSLSGASRDILDTLGRQNDFNWSIQQNKVFIIPTDKYLDNVEAVVLNSANGMIGSPIVTEVGADVTCLLNPDIIPYRSLKIESVLGDVQLGVTYFVERVNKLTPTQAEGIYKTLEVTHSGDNRGGEWVSTVVCSSFLDKELELSNV